ncbi:hypothetical protein BDR03DRAFT_979675 [Suillus americanus]|nr:hypothetical protein BDR03DRAFT_979675 [Suillus americanus]
MTTGHFTHILNILKKWLSRLARRSASLFFVVLSSLHRFVAGHLKFGDRRLITRFPSGVLPRSQEGIGGEGSPICPSLLPPGQMGREATEQPPSPSDDPYTGSHPRPLRKGTAIPPLDANPTTIGYTSGTQTDGLHEGSVSSLHSSLNMEESSVKSKRSHKDGALQEFSSPGPSRLSGLHEGSTTHSQPRGYMDDAHSINTTRTRSTRHLTPSMPYSQYASDSRVSVGSLTRSIAGSEVRQAAYRTHTGPVYSRPISVSSMADVHHVHYGSPNAVSIPLDSSAQAVPLSDHGFDHHVHYTAPPDSNELPGQEVVMVYDGPPTCPMVTDNVKRNLNVTDNTVRPMTMGPYEMNVPQGWTAFVHPEGARYFVNQETRTFTEMNVCEPDICDDIEYFMRILLGELEQTIGEGGLSLMKEVDLVLEPKSFDGESVVCCYYFANHRDRCLFWLDDFNPEHIISECKGIRSSSHLWFAIEAQYWRHWDYFPGLCPVTQSIVDELRDMLIHATCDHLTSLGSSAAFDAIEIKDHLSVVDKIKVHTPPPTPPTHQNMRRGHAAIVIAHNHFLNYHGEDCVRLMFAKSVHGWTYKPSPLMVILAPLLFLDPVAQVQELHKIFVDEVAHTARWNAFCSNFKGQLQDSNLLATVLLNANVGFLAINTVDKGGRDAIQLASYMSLVTSLGSIVLGLFFVSHSRTSGQNTAMEALVQAVFLGKLHNKTHGLEKLAIIYSLPKALLMWGMAFFFAAFSTDWWTSGDITSRTVVGAVTLVVLVMISNSIILTREGAKWSWRPTWRSCGDVVQGLSSRLAGAWKQPMQLGEIDPTDDPRTHTDAIDLDTLVGFSAEADAQMRGTSHITTLPSSEIPGSDNPENHSNSPSPPVRPLHPTASVDAPQQPHGANFVFPSSDSRTNLGVLSGAGSLQQIQENTQTVFQDQSTKEARCEPGGAPLCVHFDTLPSSASEGMVGTSANALRHSDALPTTATILSKHGLQSGVVATDTDAPILPSSFDTDDREGVTYTKNVVEEPWELEHPQPSPSTTPPPRIYARSATGDHFHHAPGAPQATLLEAGHDTIEECQE